MHSATLDRDRILSACSDAGMAAVRAYIGFFPDQEPDSRPVFDALLRKTSEDYLALAAAAARGATAREIHGFYGALTTTPWPSLSKRARGVYRVFVSTVLAMKSELDLANTVSSPTAPNPS